MARVGSTTRLDDLGVETATAIRSSPLGSSISVCSGKGFATDDAEAGALGEALERYCAEPRARTASIVTASAGELCGSCLDLKNVPLPTWVSDAMLEGPLDWYPGRQWHDSTAVWVPAELVFFPYAGRTVRRLLAAPSTTGLASGSSRADAVLYGVLECVERDAHSRALVFIASGKGDQIPSIPIDRLPPSVLGRLEHLHRVGIHVYFRNLTHDLRVPTVLAVLDDGELAHSGCASRLTMGHAAEAAFLEAAQSRITDLQGAREDLAPRTDRPHPWFTSTSPVTEWDDTSEMDTASALTDLDQRLDRVGAGRIIVADLSLPGVPAHVIRAIVPGLENWALDRERAGRRVRQWLQP